MTFENFLVSQISGVTMQSAKAVLELKEEGATVPFIARYRKEKTGNLDEVKIQKVMDLKEEWDEILNRQKYIVGEIERQGKLTDELKNKVLGAFDKNVLEDLYLPFKQKRKSKSTLAKEAGLEPLADWIWGVGHGLVAPEPGQTLELWAFTFKNEEKGFKDSETAIAGAMDILVERMSEDLDLRQFVRDQYSKRAFLKTQKAEKAKPNSKYQNYFDYEEKAAALLEPRSSHRYLAIRRGWIEEELSISFGGSKVDETFDLYLMNHFQNHAAGNRDSQVKAQLEKVARIALKAHVIPSIENEQHKQLKEIADQMAIQVFSENVRKILLAPPYGPKAVLGVDPGLRTGCKLAVIDGSGKFMAETVIRLQSESEQNQAKSFILAIAESGKISSIAVGNGTAGRETEAFIRKVLKEKQISLPVVMVSEAGASVYSASAVAREEFPELDVTVRGAISIARRFQDPLAELVKIDPKSIGVGQYQHDVSQTGLKRALDHVVDSCVNAVGVNVNTGSVHLLSHVSGIGEGLAKAMVEYRETNGIFKSREDLNKVARFSKKTYELAAGFLRIPESANPLDHTGVHPERYADLEAIAKSQGKSVSDFIGSGAKQLLSLSEAKERLGEFTLKDIVTELEKPGRDPRAVFVPIQFREDLSELKEVQPGMVCPGVVTNVTNFGAFVDIGVHQDGLVHISQLGNKFVTDPSQVVSPGDKVTVRVLEVNLEKSQMALTMKVDEKPKSEPRPRGGAVEPKKLVVSYEGDRRPEPRNERPTGRTFTPPASTAGSSSGFSSAMKPKKPAQAFNNPFAGLASLKDALKK
jgi:uncharacterized protein